MATGKLGAFPAVVLAILVLLAGCAGVDERAPAAATPPAARPQVADTTGLGRAEPAARQAMAAGESGNTAFGPAFPREAAAVAAVADGIDRAAAAARATPAPRPAAAGADEIDRAAAGNAAGRETGEVTARQIIVTAELTIAAASVEGAVIRARRIAESLGGFVEQLSSAGGNEPPQADLTIRVPQAQFSPALERLEALGVVQFRTLGREDVTEQHIDLSARLKSAGREEQSLLALLERSGSVAEILAVERELARVRADIERGQGQLDFLERRVDLATIRLTLLPPERRPTDPPRASFALEVSNVADRVARLKDFVANLDGEVDEVYWLTSADGEQANVTFRVYAANFPGAAEFVERQGRVRHKELRERGNRSETETPRPEYPDSRIVVSYGDPNFDFQPWLLAGILMGIAALAGGAALAIRIAYRRGRIRGRFF